MQLSKIIKLNLLLFVGFALSNHCTNSNDCPAKSHQIQTKLTAQELGCLLQAIPSNAFHGYMAKGTFKTWNGFEKKLHTQLFLFYGDLWHADGLMTSVDSLHLVPLEILPDFGPDVIPFFPKSISIFNTTNGKFLFKSGKASWTRPLLKSWEFDLGLVSALEFFIADDGSIKIADITLSSE